MTPFAMKLWEDKCTPEQHRKHKKFKDFYKCFNGFHCFDMRGVKDLIQLPILTAFKEGLFGLEARHLPAEKIWLEWPEADGLDCGTLINSKFNGDSYLIEYFYVTPLFCVRENFQIGDDDRSIRKEIVDIAEHHLFLDSISSAYPEKPTVDIARLHIRQHIRSALTLINFDGFAAKRKVNLSPRASRRLAGMRVNGSYPLRAYTEVCVKLSNKDATPWRQSGTSGLMPLHFVRGHFRRYQGIRRYINGYWRGDAALGIKQQRWKLVK